MTRKLALFLCGVVFACGAVVQSSAGQNTVNLGASTAADDGRGIGGTGIPAMVDDGRGIGGTGIIGTITEFGSIWVNGLEIELGDATAILLDGQPLTEAQLRLGQQVAVLANQDEGVWYADQVIVNHVVAGEVEQVTPSALVINGITVKPDSSMPGQWPSVTVGEQLSISGYFDDGTVYVTDAQVHQSVVGDWQVTGPVTQDASGSWSIAGALAIPTAETEVLGLTPGDSVTAVGEAASVTFTKNRLPFQDQAIKYLIENRFSDREPEIQWSEGSELTSIENLEDGNDPNQNQRKISEPSRPQSNSQIKSSSRSTTSSATRSTSHSTTNGPKGDTRRR